MNEETCEGRCEIQLTRGMMAIVDAADYVWLSEFRWSAVDGNNKRAKQGGIWYARYRRSYMHRAIMGFPDYKVDHRDGNGLHNWRDNLRLATNAENASHKKPVYNKTGYIGVFWDAVQERWEAQITVNYRNIKIGRYATKEEAARARDEAAKKYHGEFATLNFP